MNVLDLFSGIGGFSLGLERAGMTTIAFCEIEEFPRKVLRKHWPAVPIFEDIRKLHAEDITEAVDLICGGYPCQPFSLAGKRQGQADDRHLWPEMFRIVREIRPSWVVAENVAGHVNMGLDEVLSDLESECYQTATFIIPACGINAPHRRYRVWVIANSNETRCQREDISIQSRQEGQTNNIPSWVCKTVADSIGNRLEGAVYNRNCYQADEAYKGGAPSRVPMPGVWEGYNPEPGILGVDARVSGWMDRVKALGNSVIPQIPEIIGRAIMEIEMSGKD